MRVFQDVLEAISHQIRPAVLIVSLVWKINESSTGFVAGVVAITHQQIVSLNHSKVTHRFGQAV